MIFQYFHKLKLKVSSRTCPGGGKVVRDEGGDVVEEEVEAGVLVLDVGHDLVQRGLGVLGADVLVHVLHHRRQTRGQVVHPVIDGPF